MLVVRPAIVAALAAEIFIATQGLARAFTLALAATGASRRADAAGIAAIWYPNPCVKYVVSFERTVFDRSPDGPRRAEHALVFRLQPNIQPSS